MLTELRIRNFAIIDQLQLSFGPGLNILTGETGAGKSIIIDAMGLLLGDRAGADWVRAGADLAEIEATFQLPPAPAPSSAVPTATATTTDGAANGEPAAGPVDIAQLVAAQGLDDPDNPGWVVLSREVRTNGRNICRVNGRSVNLQTLAALAAALIDVHGQGEHLTLLHPKTHVHLLDRYAGLQAQQRQLAAEVSRLRAIRAELVRLRQEARTVAQRMDLLSFQAGEILGARLRPGEDAELESERRRLSNAESLLTLAQTVTGILHDSDGEVPAALDLVSDAVGKLEKLARIDPDMAATAAEAESLHEQLRDLVRSVQDYADGLEFNPERLAEVEERVELIAAFRRKYGDSVEQINAFGLRAQAELEELSGREARTGALEKEEERLLRTIGALAAALSARRRSAGETLARQVEQELAELRMNRARIAVAVEQESQPGGAYWPDGRRVAFDLTGADKVEFLISANVGEPLKPMARVASGGETARLMLALKSTLANADATPTLIFDEIDQGIGGRVGAIVGQKLWRLTGQLPPPSADGGALPHQVLCITHLPQLAVFGDDHLTVNKQVRAIDGQERTSTVVRLLSGDERTAELMSMLGASSEAGRRSVEEMLAEVAAVKRGVRLMS